MSSDHVLEISARHDRHASWGRPAEPAVHLAGRIITELARRVGAQSPSAVRGAAPRLPESRIDAGTCEQIARVAPVRTDDDARLALSLGKSYPDLVAARAAQLDRACDIVVRPRNEAELERMIALLSELDIAVVPVGGGTTVVGGIEPIGRTSDQPVAAIDLAEIDSCHNVDRVSRVATFGAGIRGPRLEAALEPFGLTLGHVPQSFELSTLGGWVATRSAGQGSLRFGKIESMVGGLRLCSPSGMLDVPHLPAHGAGPDLRELLVGSEGTMGIITRATMRVVDRPERIGFATYVHPTFADASDAARTLVQSGIRPTMVRVSDHQETAFSIGGSLPRALRGRIAGSAVRLAGLAQGSMTIVLMTGSSSEIRATELQVDHHMRRTGGRPIGHIPAQHWYRARFHQPYVRDLIMDAGYLVDTLETAVPWSSLHGMHRDVRRALEDSLGAGRCMVGCHLSHLYRDGASAYFTFLARVEPGAELDTWGRAKRAVHAELARHGAAVSHQHGVGTMHRDLFDVVTPTRARQAWRQAREAFDPEGIMNPGKCFVASPDGSVPLNAHHASLPG